VLKKLKLLFCIAGIIDNFEWAEGYTEKFGIYQINFTSPLKERTPKKSAFFFQDTIRNWSFELDGGYDYA
jgi:beta-glucosidase/6-phospho-beta-glucosidase/beta-galactosidase